MTRKLNLGLRGLEWIKSAKTMQVQIKHKGQTRWAKDGGYDESYLNRGDLQCFALQEQYLEEMQ